MRPFNFLSRALCACLLFSATAYNAFAESTQISQSFDGTHLNAPTRSLNDGNDPDTTVLPVNFGPMSAVLREEQLTVRWETLYESRNTHFELEMSTNGVNFEKFGEVNSKAPQGNSDIPIQYEHKVENARVSLWISAGFLGVLVSGAFHNRKKQLFWVTLIITAGTIFSCNKQQYIELSEEDKTFFIRVMQVDKDGRKSSSKCVQAVRM